MLPLLLIYLLQVIVMVTNEFTFFVIPAALLYFYSLSQDFIERFEHEDQEV
jgi:hypothetical protein